MTDHPASKPAELSCPDCGSVVYPDETFCEECGHRLDGSAAVPEAVEVRTAPREGATIRQTSASQRRRAALAARPCAGCGATGIDADGYCETCGLRQPADRDHVEIVIPVPGAPDASANGSAAGAEDAEGAALAAGVSDRGLRYSRNEDALALVAHAAGVAAVVSDGVGSSQRPEDASRAAADTGAAELAARLDAGEDPEDATRAAALRAAAAVAALAGSPAEAPSCTYVSAVTRGGSVTVGWVGDSRAYWLSADEPAPGSSGDATGPGAQPDGERDGAADGAADDEGPDTAELVMADTGDMAELSGSQQLTEDDSWAAIMVAEGALTEAEAEAHPNAHVITAWLGADAGEVRPHVRTFRPSGPGTLLVCSDGLWNYVPAAADLAALLAGAADGTAPGAAGAPLAAARTLVRHALDAGGRDNVTVAVIPLPSPATVPSSERDR
ncbi:protein phosphatase 2C domain-containing protein [Actinomadura fibrosa]|uniref:Protein phosphatase 2C domain-containing protein n=2 Tax=Actinomadura fibrosa TaxID=111802 RepID=A0ABW2Y0F4_9ACTN